MRSKLYDDAILENSVSLHYLQWCATNEPTDRPSFADGVDFFVFFPLDYCVVLCTHCGQGARVTMGDWLDDDWDADAAPAPAATAASGAVPDSWADEDMSEEETPAAKQVQAPAAMKPSKARALAMKERERKEMEAAAERRRAHEARLAEMSAVERKMEQQRIVEEADLDNARDLFGGGTGGKTDDAPKADTIDTLEPQADADFDKLAAMIGTKCRAYNTNPRRTLRYLNFVKSVTRELTRDLGPDDAKDLASFMGVLSNEKLAASKRAKGGKKKAPSKKSHVKVDRADDMGDGQYDDYDEFDGFM